jgi:hypothetical protein
MVVVVADDCRIHAAHGVFLTSVAGAAPSFLRHVQVHQDLRCFLLPELQDANVSPLSQTDTRSTGAHAPRVEQRVTLPLLSNNIVREAMYCYLYYYYYYYYY